jgi:hypothetical protein
MRSTHSKRRRFPKFDSIPSLIVGTVFASILSSLNIWSLVSGWHDAVFPFQLTKWLGSAVGLVLAVHTVDVARSKRKH